MDILTLTTSAAIRAAIGVSEKSGELEDQVLTDLSMPDLLLLELSSWLPVSIDDVEAGYDGATDETAKAALAWLALKAASTYYCATVVLESGEISFAERYEDGQNKVKRQSTDYQALLDRLAGKYAYYRQQVLTYLETPAEVYANNWMIGSSIPTYDPVTNSST